MKIGTLHCEYMVEWMARELAYTSVVIFMTSELTWEKNPGTKDCSFQPDSPILKSTDTCH